MKNLFKGAGVIIDYSDTSDTYDESCFKDFNVLPEKH